jgi:peptidoglycan/LPS O-acetylase OafA/YrhL
MAVEVGGLLSILVIVLLTPSLASTWLQQEVPIARFHRQFLLFSFLWSMVLLASVDGGGLIQRVFASPILRYFGFISFSMYLFHTTVIKLIVVFAPELPLRAWVAVSVTAGISHLTWMSIERPSAKIRVV